MWPFIGCFMVILFLFGGVLSGLAAAAAAFWLSGSLLLALLAYSIFGAMGGVLAVGLIAVLGGPGDAGSGPTRGPGPNAPARAVAMRPALI